MANESAIVRSALYKTLQTTLTNTSSVLLFTNNDTNNLFNFTIYVSCKELNARIDITNETANMFVNSSDVSGSIVNDNNKYYLVIAGSKTLTSPIIKKDINSINDISKIDFTSKHESTSSTNVLISFESGQKAQFGSGVVFNKNLKFNNDVEINSIDANNKDITVTSANINVTNAIATDTITAPNITVGETKTKTSADGKVTTTTTGTLTVHDTATTTTLNVTGTSTFGNIAVDGNSSTSKITLGTQDITGLATGAFRTSFTNKAKTLTKIYIAFPLNTLKERYNTANKTDINTFTLMAGKIDNDNFSITYTDGKDLVLTIGSKSIILGTTPSNYEGKFIYNTNSYTLNNNQQELSISTVLTESFTTKNVYDKTSIENVYDETSIENVYDKTSIVKILNTTLSDDNKSSTLVTANALDEALAIMGQASISTISSLNANYENNDKLGNDAHVLTQESATSTTVNNKVGFDSTNGEYINLNGTKVYKEATADNLGPVKVKYDTKNKTLTISTK